MQHRPPINPVSCIAGPEDAAILAAARILISPLPVQAISWTIRSMIFSSVTPASRQTCRSCCGHCVQKIAGHRRSGAQRFWVGDDVIRCLVYRSALVCGVTLSETRTVLQSSSSSSVTMKLVISDDFPFLQQGTGHEEIAQISSLLNLNCRYSRLLLLAPSPRAFSPRAYMEAVRLDAVSRQHAGRTPIWPRRSVSSQTSAPMSCSCSQSGAAGSMR